MSDEQPADPEEKLSEEKLRARYGALPNQKALMERRMRGEGPASAKKYFDSADWAKSLSPTDAPSSAARTSLREEAKPAADAD